MSKEKSNKNLVDVLISKYGKRASELTPAESADTWLGHNEKDDSRHNPNGHTPQAVVGKAFKHMRKAVDAERRRETNSEKERIERKRHLEHIKSMVREQLRKELRKAPNASALGISKNLCTTRSDGTPTHPWLLTYKQTPYSENGLRPIVTELLKELRPK